MSGSVLWSSLGLLILLYSHVVRAGTITFDGVTFASQGSKIGPTIDVDEPLSGVVMVAGYWPTYNVSEILGCNTRYALGENAFSNKIALIERGNCSFQDKIANAQFAGAIGVIIFDHIPNNSLTKMTYASDLGDAITIPSFFISYDAGDRLKQSFLESYSQSGTGVYVVITVLEDEYEDDIVSFAKKYSNLGIIFGCLLGVSVIYWISFCAWRGRQSGMRARAMKSMNRVKYSPQVVAAATAQTDIETGLDPTGSPISQTSPESSIATTHLASQDNENAPSYVVVDKPVESDQAIKTDEFDVANSEQVSVVAEHVEGEDSPVANSPNSKLINPSNSVTKFFRRGRKGKGDAKDKPVFDTEHCTVCLDDFEKDEDLLVLPCRHIFHPDCVSDWLVTHGQCPVCKANVIDSGQKAGEAYPRVGLGCLFGYPVPQTLIMWFVCLCFAVMLSYFLAVAGLII